jgi:hypothetical protein
LRETAVENGMKIYPGKIKVMMFTRAGVKSPLGYCGGNKKSPDLNSFKYLGIISRNDLNLSVLMSYIYIYGAPCKARNVNVVYIWTYVWQR